MPYTRPFPSDFMLGQQVQLKVGGAPMVIEDYCFEKQRWICLWVNESNYLKRGQIIMREHFGTEVLKKYTSTAAETQSKGSKESL